jgi:hypothetical protein
VQTGSGPDGDAGAENDQAMEQEPRRLEAFTPAAAPEA